MDIATLLPQFSAAFPEPDQAAECGALAAELEAQQQQADQALAAVTADYEAKIAELVQLHAVELQTTRQEICEQQAVQLAETVTGQIAQAAEDIADCAGRALKPFLELVVSKAATADFCNKLKQAASANMQAAITLEGPSDLVEACRKALAESGMTLLTGSPTPELQALIGEERLQSNLQAWLHQLAEHTHG